jgi:hypothetical protein
MLFYPHLVSAQDDEDGSCPGAQVVNTFSGTGNQTTPVFETQGESFRISFDATNTRETERFNISVDSGEDGLISSVSQEGAGSGESFVSQGPGSYSLDIASALLQYDIIVEDCNGGGSGGNGVDPASEPLPSEDQYPSENDENVSQSTPHTGGPSLSVVAAILLWFGVGGILVARRFA